MVPGTNGTAVTRQCKRCTCRLKLVRGSRLVLGSVQNARVSATDILLLRSSCRHGQGKLYRTDGQAGICSATPSADRTGGALMPLALRRCRCALSCNTGFPGPREVLHYFLKGERTLLRAKANLCRLNHGLARRGLVCSGFFLSTEACRQRKCEWLTGPGVNDLAQRPQMSRPAEAATSGGLRPKHSGPGRALKLCQGLKP